MSNMFIHPETIRDLDFNCPLYKQTICHVNFMITCAGYYFEIGLCFNWSIHQGRRSTMQLDRDLIGFMENFGLFSHKTIEIVTRAI